MARDVDQMYTKIFEMLAMVGRMGKPTDFDKRALGRFVYFEDRRIIQNKIGNFNSCPRTSEAAIFYAIFSMR